MRAGALRHRLVFLDPVETKSSTTGQTTVEYTDTVASVHGQITPVQGSKPMADLQLRAETSHLIACRWFEGATTRTRIRHQRGTGSERWFEILSILNVGERDRDMQVQARELVS